MPTKPTVIVADPLVSHDGAVLRNECGEGLKGLVETLLPACEVFLCFRNVVVPVLVRAIIGAGVVQGVLVRADAVLEVGTLVAKFAKFLFHCVCDEWGEGLHGGKS